MRYNYDNYYRGYYDKHRTNKIADTRRYRQRLAQKYGVSQRQAIRINKLIKGDTMGKFGTKNMTEQEYDTIKSLLGMGLTGTQISKVTGRSLNTVHHIKKSQDWDGYRNRMKALSQRRHANSPVKNFAKAVDKLDIGKRDMTQADPQLVNALNDLSEAMNNLALSWNTLSSKMDDVLETKRPWMFRQKG